MAEKQQIITAQNETPNRQLQHVKQRHELVNLETFNIVNI